jgi:ketosteroid isomerase-like protein
MSKADQRSPRSPDFQPQRHPLMRLLVAVGLAMTLGGAANATSVQDEARQFFERFVAAQNAHDLAAVGSMLWNSDDFLWVTRGVQVRGSKTALNMFGSFYTGTWHLDPDTNQLKATALPDGTVQILVPMTFTRGEPGQATQQATFLISQTIIRDPNGWHVATILPIADTHLK